MRTRKVSAHVAALFVLVLVAAACHPRTYTADEDALLFTETELAAGHGFGGGTLFTPETLVPGQQYPALVAVPGWTNDNAGSHWLDRILADAGYIVLSIDTNSPLDLMGSRAEQLEAARDYLVTGSEVATFVDPDRVAVRGISMGGGGALRFAAADDSLAAVIAMVPYNTPGKDFSAVESPTLIIACEGDTIAQNWNHSERFYDSLEPDLPKAYVLINHGTDHACIGPGDAVWRSTLAWMDRYVARDETVDVCDLDLPEADVSDVRIEIAGCD